jgi:RNA polymerase primary sigma factor
MSPKSAAAGGQPSIVSARKATPASCAVDWFDPEHGLRLSTYATWWICQGVQRGLRDRGRAMIRLPVHGGDRVAKAHAAHTTLSAELGCDTDAGAEELAVRLG